MVLQRKRISRLRLVFYLLFVTLNVVGQEPGVSNYKEQDAYKHFYGICWRGDVGENLQYARNMGYRYVFYQEGMEHNPYSNELAFYLESPEYTLYKRTINLKKQYTAAEIEFYSSFCVTIHPEKEFPYNLATGWYFSDSSFSVELDYTKEAVRKWTINGIKEKVKAIITSNPRFKFAGLAWDVPQLSGDFWSGRSGKGAQVTLAYWTTEAQANNYQEGKKIYYQELFRELRTLYPSVKIIMEPNRIEGNWLSTSGNGDVEIMPNLISQETKEVTALLHDNIYQSGIINKGQLGYSSPSIKTDTEYLDIAGQLAVKGIWFNWFGRFGGTGGAINYQHVQEVPALFLFLRAFVNWENLNKTALSKRSYANGRYTSPTAFFSKEVVWAKKMETNAVYALFLTAEGTIPLKGRFSDYKIYFLDSLMGKGEACKELFRYKKGKLYLKDYSRIGKPFLIEKI